MQFSEMTAMLGLLLVMANISVVSSIYTGGSRYPYMPAILSDAISSRSWEEVSYNYECILSCYNTRTYSWFKDAHTVFLNFSLIAQPHLSFTILLIEIQISQKNWVRKRPVSTMHAI